MVYEPRMSSLEECFVANRKWAADMVDQDPEFFRRLEHTQKPDMLWIGCADARIPPNELMGKLPGDIFVHRNVANLVVHTDVNCLSVLQYAVDVLQVRHVVVCGHYGCGGIAAALATRPLGLIDNWLRQIRDVHLANREELDVIDDPARRASRLAELNVQAQLANVCHTTIVQDAWRRGQPLTVHGWIYALADGLIRDLGMVVESADQIPVQYRLY